MKYWKEINPHYLERFFLLWVNFDDSESVIEIKKAGRFENSLVLLGVTSLWHFAHWVSRAPPDNTLPAFLNLNGKCIYIKKKNQFIIFWIAFSRTHVNFFYFQLKNFKYRTLTPKNYTIVGIFSGSLTFRRILRGCSSRYIVKTYIIV